MPNDTLAELSDDAREVVHHLREGRFARSLALMTSVASLLTGLEVAYEHYRGSYSQRIMYTPVGLSAVLAGAGLWAACKRPHSRVILRGVSMITMLDGCIGFGFHVRGIARKPGGWGLPVTNVVMGPPVFSPILFATSAYLGLISSYLRDEGDLSSDAPAPTSKQGPWFKRFLPPHESRALISLEQDIREGKFQQHLLLVTALSASLSGMEAWYSHYKNNFRNPSQYSPIVIASALAVACVVGTQSRPVARRAVPAIASLAVLDAGVGMVFHVRGILRRSGGLQHLPYNIMYGPPIFAPLLFGAAGMFGLLASLLRRETP